MKLPEAYDLDANAVALLEKLRRLAIEYQTICQQAPHIWDAENVEDSKLAKMGCNGQVSTRDGAKKRTPECPIKNLCLQTALATHSDFGVWGGLTALERKRLRRH